MKLIARLFGRVLVCGTMSVALAASDDPAVMQSHRAAADFALSTDPDSAAWHGTDGVIATTDPFGRPWSAPALRIEADGLRIISISFSSATMRACIRSRIQHRKRGMGFVEYDVAEVFIGYDLENIYRYKEFEISPDGEFIDLDVDRQRKGKEVDWLWNSGLRYKTRIDRDRKVWICEMQIPWQSIDVRTPKPGNELRLNLYRIEGGPKDRKYIVWRPIGNPSYHTPEKFGRLRLAE